MTNEEWEDTGRVVDTFYHVMKHLPCNTTVYIHEGRTPACPKCEPEAWAKLRDSFHV
jgi:hypothetical protein